MIAALGFIVRAVIGAAVVVLFTAWLIWFDSDLGRALSRRRD